MIIEKKIEITRTEDFEDNSILWKIHDDGVSLLFTDVEKVFFYLKSHI